MASVRDTLYEMLTQYPSLFENRTDCFVHLFLTNGNGYDWVKGELVSWSEPKDTPAFQDEWLEVQKYKDSDKDVHEWEDSHYDWVRLNVRRDNARVQFAIDNFDLMMKEVIAFYSGRRIHYSGWEFCPLMQVPENVTDDWREAIHEVMAALISYIHQILQFYGEHLETQINALKDDLQRLKKEKFPEVIQREKELAKILAEIMADTNKK